MAGSIEFSQGGFAAFRMPCTPVQYPSLSHRENTTFSRMHLLYLGVLQDVQEFRNIAALNILTQGKQYLSVKFVDLDSRIYPFCKAIND
jgi:hypothetical protein